jgi:hypothetical protein
MAQAPTAANSTRAYSYEPSMRSNSGAVNQRSQIPSYLVPKTQR